MKQYRIVLGIEIGKNILRAAEIEHREGNFFLSRVAERELETLQVGELVQKISVLISEEVMLSRIASVAIDTTLSKRDTIEVDSDLQPEEIVDLLKAEIDFHNNFGGQEFRPAYEITSTLEGGYKQVFYAAIDRTLLNSVKDAFTRCGLDLQYIDLDHSCTELAVNRLTRSSKNYILITVKDEQVEASFCVNGERKIYKYVNFSGEPFYHVTKIAQDLELLGKETAEAIYMTGIKVDTFLIDLLKKNVDRRYELFVPTQNLLLSPVASANTKLRTLPHHFSSAIGAALK